MLRRFLGENPVVRYAIQREVSRVLFKRHARVTERLEKPTRVEPLGHR